MGVPACSARAVSETAGVISGVSVIVGSVIVGIVGMETGVEVAVADLGGTGDGDGSTVGDGNKRVATIVVDSSG
jgi:hypothetical protein